MANVNSKEKRAEKVITGAASVRKKSEARKFTDVFVSEDISSVKSYVFMDVLVPALKDALYNIINEGASMMLFGKSGAVRRDNRSSNSPKVSYRSYSDEPRNRKYANSDTRDRFDYDEIVYTNRGDAEYVLKQLYETLDEYKRVRVLDIYDFSGLTAPFTADRYGWMDLRNARVEHVRGGWIIRLPKPMSID